jgi:hypothetical protein
MPYASMKPLKITLYCFGSLSELIYCLLFYPRLTKVIDEIHVAYRLMNQDNNKRLLYFIAVKANPKRLLQYH